MSTPTTPGPATDGAEEPAPLYPFANPSALEPPAEWAELRDRCPVATVRMASGDETLLLTRYADVRGLLSDPRFSRQLVADDAARVSTTDDGGVFGKSGPVGAQDADDPEDQPAISLMGGEGHRRWRRLLTRSFTVKRVQALQPAIEARTHELIDAMVAAGAPANLGPALGFPLPVYVICDLLGVPSDAQEKFAYWSDTMLNLSRYSQEEVASAGGEFYRYMTEHVAAKRANPGDDLLSELAAVVDAKDGRMTEAELVLTGQGLLIAGHETTSNMITKMVAMLLARRERWEAVLADRSLVRTAVEESLRFDANPGFGMPRYVSEPVEAGGTTIPAGTTVVCSMASANRDDREFAGPDDMDLQRSPNPHVAFGAGPHACIGQSLARVELRTVLSVLLDRLPTLELAVDPGDLAQRQGLIVGGIEEVPVRW